MMDYHGKVVIITGGTKGIGAGCVRVFVDAGSRVIFCSRNQDEGEKLAGLERVVEKDDEEDV